MTNKTKAIIDLESLLNNNAIDPVQFQYFKNLEKRTIIINDFITQDIIEMALLPLIEMDNDGSNKPIEILINSKGGSVFDGLVLCDVIDNLKTKTTVTVLGYAYSMAGIILASGFNNPNVHRRCYNFSTALLHAGSSYLEGATSIVKDTFKFQEKIDNKIKDFILSHSKISIDEYDRMERTEWYMDSDTMLEKGLVDEIIQ